MSAQAESASPVRLRASIIVIASGIFVTEFGWPRIIGRLPFTLLFKNQLGLTAERVATFWAVATVAYYCKPLVGLVCDAYPLFGTRRRAYLLWGSVLSAAAWAAFAVVPRRYLPFMLLMTALNGAMVFVNTAVGGLQVETAQRHGASGRLASLRSAIEGSMYLLGGPLGGWLASRAFGWTAAAGAAILLAFVPIVALLYREPRGARADATVFATARRQLETLVRSRPMLATSAVLFLFYLAPGFRTPLVYYQQDVLQLDAPFMGALTMLSGAGCIVGAAIYGVVCRHVPLRVSIYAGIVLSGVGVLLYLKYDSARSAAVIEAAFGVIYMLGSLPLYDLVARVAPKGSESFGYGLMISVRNVALYAISDVIGSWLYASLHLGLPTLVWINALSTLAVVLFVPLIPRAILTSREQPLRLAGVAERKE